MSMMDKQVSRAVGMRRAVRCAIAALARKGYFGSRFLRALAPLVAVTLLTPMIVVIGAIVVPLPSASAAQFSAVEWNYNNPPDPASTFYCTGANLATRDTCPQYAAQINSATVASASNTDISISGPGITDFGRGRDFTADDLLGATATTLGVNGLNTTSLSAAKTAGDYVQYGFTTSSSLLAGTALSQFAFGTYDSLLTGNRMGGDLDFGVEISANGFATAGTLLVAPRDYDVLAGDAVLSSQNFQGAHYTQAGTTTNFVLSPSTTYTFRVYLFNSDVGYSDVLVGANYIDDLAVFFSNATISMTKALSANRLSNTDQFTVQIKNGATVLTTPGNDTSAGSGSTVTAGTGTTGATNVTPGTSYTLTEVAAGSTNLNNYVQSISCTNGNAGSATVLPSGATQPFTINPTSAADVISCTLTNLPKADLSVTKTDGVALVAQGATASYAVVVSNAGPGAASNAIFTDPAVSKLTVTGVSCGSVTGGAACPTAGNTTVALMQGSGIVIPTLPSGGSVTFTVSGTVGAAATGTMANTATVAAPATVVDPTPGNNSATDTDTIQTPSVTIQKSASPLTVSAAGQTVNYSFLVTNTGNVTLTSLAVNDTFTAPAGPALTISCPVTTLAAGASTTCTASYVVTVADMNQGTIKNSATATATPPVGGPITSAPSTATVTATQTPGISIVKSATVNDLNGNGKTDLGDTIVWSFVVKNTGNVTLTGVAVSDAKAGTVNCPSPSLAPGVSETCSAAVAYTITQADVDAGQVANTATSSGSAPTGGPITSAPSSTTTPVVQTSTLQLTKSAAVTDVNGNGLNDLGDRIAWSFLVKNTGTTTITNVAVADPTAGAVSCPVTSLAPGASTTCTATTPHTITQADVDGGVVNNTATASGKNSVGGTVTSNPSSTSTPVVQTAALFLTKSAVVTDVNADGKTDLGDRIAWSFLVKNTGTTTITNVAVADPTAGAVSCPVTTLAPGASTTCTATTPHAITQAEVDAGHVDNTATATGKNPGNGTVTSNPSSTTTPVVQTAALTVTKSATSTPATLNAAGQSVSYSFLVKNTGNVTVTGIGIADTFTAPAGPVPMITCPVTTLAPGATTTCTAAAYPVKQVDVDKGSIANSATASGLDPHSASVVSAPSALTVPITRTPALSLQKSVGSIVDTNGDGVNDAGDRINWTFKVTNTGNVTVTTVGVSDAKAGTISCPATTLAPGAFTTCTAAAYSITQVEGDAGVVNNTATATGQDPAGATVTSNPSSTSTPLVRTPAITITKSAAVTDVNASGVNDLGDQITWSFLVKNTGNVTLTSVTVNDAKAGAVSCPVTTLAPGATTTCTVTTPYTITQTDVDAGSVQNSATATGTPPTGGPVTSSPSTTNTPVGQTSSLQLTKSAAVTDVNGDSLTDLGDRIQWSFLVKNTGTTTITTVAITDPVAGASTCLATTLAPGASTTCTATMAHPISQSDVDNGVVSNTATATGKNPANATVTSNPSSTDTPVVQVGTLALLKSASVTDLNANGRTDLGDRITWTFKVTNTGTLTLHNVAVTDPTAGGVSCPVTTLAPGAFTTCTAAPHTITQAEVDARVVNNTANATALRPSGATVASNPSSTSTPVSQISSLQLTKSAAVTDVNADGKTDLGDTIAWSFLLTNTGTTTLTGLAVADPTAGVVSCPVTTLVPGASTTCTAAAAHTITQAEVDAGHVDNTAMATGKDPSNGTVTSNPSSTSTPVAQVSSLQLTKSAAVTDVNADGNTDLGDTIAWSFLVRNTGTTTITSLVISDPVAGAITCPVTTLAPSASTTCTANAVHVIGQADVDAGIVSNTAVAGGTGPAGAVTSNPSSTDNPVAQASALQLTKSAAVTDVNADGATDLGDTIAWSFLVQNAGTTTIANLTVSDPVAGAVTCPVTTLAPGAVTTCTGTTSHSITQAEVDAGVVSNTAIATGQDPAGVGVPSNPSSTDTPVAQAPALTLTKSAAVTDVDADGATDLGDTVAWSFLVQNTGTTTITNLIVSDPTAGAVTCPVTTLAPGASTTCTAAAHTITQADVDSGVVDNTASAVAKDPNGRDVPSNPSSTSTPVVRTPALALTKLAAVSDVNSNFKIDLGDTIAWSFLAKNTGTTTITNLVVSDPVAGAVTCPVTTLAPGASTTCTAAPHTITQVDVDNGVVSNTALASGKDPVGNDVPSNQSSTDTPVAQAPALQLTKSATATDVDADGTTDLGDTIAWSFLVQNAGTTTITNLTVSDPVAGAVTCPVTTLAPGASTTCTASVGHTITQADVDAGVVSNTATATGQDPAGVDIPSNPSSTETPISQAPALTLTKSAVVTDVNADGATDLGDTIAWSFLVKNTGNTTISALTVSDPTAGAVTCPVATLAPGGSTTCTASVGHTITQADVDAGVVSNTATATGHDPHGTDLPSNPSSIDTPVAQSAALQLTKSAAVTDVNADGATDLGDTIAWAFLVKNTGTTTITALTVSDPTAGAVTCPVTTLAPAASTTCSATAHTITQADVDSGVVSNTATATGKDPAGNDVPSNPSSTDTPVAQAPALTLTKSATTTDVNGDFVIDLGDTIQWSFLVKNTGTTTITNLVVSDPVAGVVTCPVTTLAPGASTTCTAATAHTITQADVDAGVVSNTATATGRDPNGVDVPSGPSSTDTPITQAPALTLTKSATVTDVDGDGQTDLGDTVAWSFLLTNTGTTTITNLVVSDPTAGAVSCPVTTLGPGASTTCTASPHTVTQADVDAGVVSNTATATGEDPNGVDVPSNPSSTDTPIAQAPALTLTKSATVIDVDADGATDLGDTVAWSFLVDNTGTTTITGLTVSDPSAGAVTCLVTTLAPGASTTCSANIGHTITQADVDAGVVSNTATATGQDPHGADVPSNPSSTDTPVVQAPALELTKTAAVADVDADGQTGLGDTIQWSFLLTNTGTTTITNLTVADPTAGAVTCPVTTLAPGASTTCTATVAHVITQADVDAGVVSNTATAEGTDPTGNDVPSNPSSTDTPVAQAPALLLTKSATVTDVNNDGRNDLGDTIRWSFLVKNTGTVTLTNVGVSDPTAGAVTCPVTTLAPGASTTCVSTVPHTVTQADVDVAVVTNTATATATSPSGSAVPSNPSSTSTPISQRPIPTLTKTATVADVNANGKTDLGDVVTWGFKVENTGTVTLSIILVTDPTAGGVTCPTTVLAPGESMLCTAAPHTIVQADVDAGVVSNTAIATAETPTGTPVQSNPSSTDTPVTQAPALTLTKSATVTDVDGDGQTDLGDTVAWSFLVQNTGTTTLTGVAVADPTAGAVTCPVSTLAPGASMTCTADVTHTVTQADVDAGVVSNTATATGRDPNGVDVPSNPSSADTPVAQVAALELTKSATVTDVNADGATDLGDTVAWSFLVQNTGTTTITNLVVSDPTAGAVTCPVTTLAPAASTTCTAAAHTVTQADVDAGVISNTATATGKDPNGVDVPSGPSSTDTPITQAPALTLTKSAAVTDVDGDGTTDLGDTVAWSFLVENTGTTTIANLVVSDPTAGAVSCPVLTLAPGASTTCTAAPHTVTQADVDAGVVSNSATATGKDPQGADVPSNPSSTDTPVTQAPALTLTKSATVTDVDSDGQTDLGDTIAWSFLLTNAGTTTLTGVAVADPTAGAVTCPVTTLAPGASTTCTAAAHTVSPADVNAGFVDNTATAAGKDPMGTTVPSNPSSTHTQVEASSALRLVKHASVADTNGDGQRGVGDQITWTFTLTNTGSRSLDTLSVTDPTTGAVTCPAVSLAAGTSTTCTATTAHTITQADVDAGVVSNTATAAAVDAIGSAVSSNPSSTDTPLEQKVGLRLVKKGVPTDVNNDGRVDADDTIQWSFVVTNIGLVTLRGVTLTDTKAGPVTCVETTLAPGASTTCAADNPYPITVADARAGMVHNVATATGSCGCNATVLAVHAAATVPTTKPATPQTVVPGLPFTGAIGVVWAVRGAIALLLGGAFLLLVARRRRDDENHHGRHAEL